MFPLMNLLSITHFDESWVPLQSSWRFMKGGDPKFEGLSVAAMMDLNVPVGGFVLADFTWNEERINESVPAVIDWITKTEQRSIGAVNERGVPLLLSVRFG